MGQIRAIKGANPDIVFDEPSTLGLSEIHVTDSFTDARYGVKAALRRPDGHDLTLVIQSGRGPYEANVLRVISEGQEPTFKPRGWFSKKSRFIPV